MPERMLFADESPGGLKGRADALAEAGRWSDLGKLLESTARESSLLDGHLAYLYGEALYHTGRMDDLAVHAAAYEAASRRRVDVRGTMRALNLAGIAAFELGHVSTARQKFDALMELAEADESVDMLARAANNLGAIANLRGRRHEALAYYHLAAPLYQKLDKARGLAQTHHNLGLTYRDLDRLDEAVSAFEQAISIARSLSYGFLTAVAMAGRAESELRRGDAELGERLAERAVRLARDVGDPISEAEALHVRGLARAAASGASADSDWAADLDAALSLARETGNVLLEAEIERDMGRTMRERGRDDEGTAFLESAATRFESLGAYAETRQLREELAAAP